jgi:O-antigen/teichoic acid export membrane protein
MLAGFFATPWLLRFLGARRFGAFRAMLDAFLWLSLLDSGLSRSLRANIAVRAGAGEEAAIQPLLAAGFRAYLRIGALAAAAGFGLAALLPRVLAGSGLPAAEIRLATLLLALPAVWLPSRIYNALAEASQRQYLVNSLLTLQAVLGTGMMLAAAARNWGLEGQAAAYSIAQLPTAWILWRLGSRRYPGVAWVKPDPAAARALRQLNWPGFLAALSESFALQTGNLMAGWILGPAAVSPFFLTQRLAVFSQSFLYTLETSTWAGLVELHSQGRSEPFYLRFCELTELTGALSGVLLAPVCAYNPAFLALWAGPQSYAGEAVNLLACINVWIGSVTAFWIALLVGGGKVRLWMPCAFAFTAINLVVGVPATFGFGAAGPLAGVLVGFLLVDSWALPRALGQSFDPRLRGIWPVALRPLAWVLPYAALLWTLARRYEPASWAALACQASAAGCGGILLWWASLGQAKRRQWIERGQLLSGRWAKA